MKISNLQADTKACFLFFILLSIADFIFTATGFAKYGSGSTPFNPIAIYMWQHYWIFGWLVWKSLSVGLVLLLSALYIRLAARYQFSLYWLYFSISCLNLFLIGALFQEWYFLGWINFAPDSINLHTR